MCIKVRLKHENERKQEEYLHGKPWCEVGYTPQVDDYYEQKT
jgi:hypothetical protein